MTASVVISAESQQKAFVNSWVGRHVVIRQPLYSLLYKERGLRGTITARRDGLTVVTPFNGIHFQFDGRHRVDDVTASDVLRIPQEVKTAYLKDSLLEEGAVQVIDPVLVARYDPGTELVVQSVRVKLESVRLDLALASDVNSDLATSLTVEWPAPLSKSFSERVDVEGLILQFLTPQR